MKRRIMQRFSCLLLLCALATVCQLSVSAIKWDGSSQGGGGEGGPAKTNGYAVRTTGDNCLGYRFSVVNKAGGNKVLLG